MQLYIVRPYADLRNYGTDDFQLNTENTKMNSNLLYLKNINSLKQKVKLLFVRLTKGYSNLNFIFKEIIYVMQFDIFNSYVNKLFLNSQKHHPPVNLPKMAYR